VQRFAEIWSRKKWLALPIFALAAAAGTTLTFSLPALYRSTATVIVEQGRSLAGATGELESRLQVISQEILSRSRLESLIQAEGLYPDLRRQASMEDAVNRMRSDIHTESKVQPQPSGIGSTIAFAISYRGADPETVARVANRLASFYLEQDRKIRERQTSGTVQVLKAQLDDVKQNLQEQERALGQFQDQHEGELPQQMEANLANLTRLQADLRTAADERLRAVDRRNDLLKELAEAEAAPASAATAGGAGSPATRLAQKKEELKGLRSRYSDKYPDVIRLKEEVAALEREPAPGEAAPPSAPAVASARAARLRDAVPEIESQITGLKSDEARLRGEIEEQIRRLENTPRRQRGYQEVARDYQTTRDLYDSLRKRYEQAQLDEGDNGSAPSPLRILDPAAVPIGPVAPNRLVLLFLTLVGSLVMAATAAGLADRLDTSFHSADEVRSFTRVPVVASIPLIVTAGDRRASRRRIWLAAASVLLALGFLTHAVHRVARTSEGIVLLMAKGRP